MSFQDQSAPLSNVFESFGWTIAVYVVSFGSIIGLFSCLIASIFPLPRIMYAMAEDGLLFSIFAKVHNKFKTPTWGILIAGVLTGIIAAIFDLEQMVNMISIGTVRELFMFHNKTSDRMIFSSWLTPSLRFAFFY